MKTGPDKASPGQGAARMPFVRPALDDPQPTAVRQSSHDYRRFAPVWVLLACLSAVGLARFSLWSALPIPTCGLRALTGIPCPLCGSTRCLAAWSELNPHEAFRYNPLVATAFAALLVWILLSASDRVFHQNWRGMVLRLLQRTPWRMTLITAAFANWLYLLFRLPK